MHVECKGVTYLHVVQMCDDVSLQEYVQVPLSDRDLSGFYLTDRGGFNLIMRDTVGGTADSVIRRGYMPQADILHEMKIMHHLSSEGLGARILDAWTDRSGEIMIEMEKLVPTTDQGDLLEKLTSLFLNMSTRGVICYDLHPSNVMQQVQDGTSPRNSVVNLRAIDFGHCKLDERMDRDVEGQGIQMFQYYLLCLLTKDRYLQTADSRDRAIGSTFPMFPNLKFGVTDGTWEGVRTREVSGPYNISVNDVRSILRDLMKGLDSERQTLRRFIPMAIPFTLERPVPDQGSASWDLIKEGRTWSCPQLDAGETHPTPNSVTLNVIINGAYSLSVRRICAPTPQPLSPLISFWKQGTFRPPLQTDVIHKRRFLRHEGRPGLKWVDVGSKEPDGRDLSKKHLKKTFSPLLEKLKGGLTLTQEDLDALGVPPIQKGDFFKSGLTYFQTGEGSTDMFSSDMKKLFLFEAAPNGIVLIGNWTSAWFTGAASTVLVSELESQLTDKVGYEVEDNVVYLKKEDGFFCVNPEETVVREPYTSTCVLCYDGRYVMNKHPTHFRALIPDRSLSSANELFESNVRSILTRDTSGVTVDALTTADVRDVQEVEQHVITDVAELSGVQPGQWVGIPGGGFPRKMLYLQKPARVTCFNIPPEQTTSTSANRSPLPSYIHNVRVLNESGRSDSSKWMFANTWMRFKVFDSDMESNLLSCITKHGFGSWSISMQLNDDYAFCIQSSSGKLVMEPWGGQGTIAVPLPLHEVLMRLVSNPYQSLNLPSVQSR
jgi:hypothetical protein